MDSADDHRPSRGPLMNDELRAHVILLQRQLDALTGADIAHIRHSDGGIDLARRVVNLKNAADWLIHAVRGGALSAPAEESEQVQKLHELAPWDRAPSSPAPAAREGSREAVCSAPDPLMELKEACGELDRSLDRDFGLWSSPTFNGPRASAWRLRNAVRAALAQAAHPESGA